MRIDVMDYGAKNDGVTDNTAIIQKAIDDCARAGGGQVLLTGGGKYLSYTLCLKSGVELTIDGGTTLLGGPNAELYPEIEDNPYWKPARCGRVNRRCMIYALHCEHIAITGRGTIDMHAQNFTHCTDEPMELHQVWKRKSDQVIPGRTLLLVDCTRVLLEDFRIKDSAGWATWFLKCRDMTIARLNIDCDMRLPNGDGIHISACSDVTVSDCVVRSSDDAIILRAHQEQLFEPTPCERIAISNCVLQSGSAAIRIGWTNDYLIRDCILSNLIIRKSFCGISIIVPPIYENNIDPPRGPMAPPPPEQVLPFGLETIRFKNIVMECQVSPLAINLNFPGVVCSGIHGLVLEDVSARCSGYPFILAKPEHHVSDITLRNCEFTLQESQRKGGDISWSPTMVFDYAEDVTLDKVRFLKAFTPQKG